jgi:hypothetical protein
VWAATYLVAITVSILRDEAFTWPMRIFVGVPACVFVLVAVRYALVVSLYYRRRGRTTSALRALIAIKYYQRHGQATAEVYRMRNYDSYYLHITNYQEGSLLHVRIKRRDAARLLQALAVRHPHPPLEEGWWVIGIRISTWRRPETDVVTYRIGQAPPYLRSLYDLRPIALERRRERLLLALQRAK